MAQPAKNQPAALDKTQMKKFLVPALAVAGVVLLIALVVAVSGGGGRKMSDGSDGSADDPGLKEAVPGVKVRDLKGKEGEGDPVPPGSSVKVKYTGWLADGTVFDSSEGRAVEFSLTGVVAGWREGIPGMKKGGIRKLVIAPEKGYGSKKQGKIPPDSTLIFEVELVDFTPPRNVTVGHGQPMPHDKSNGGTDDPNLVEKGGIKYRDLKEGSGEPVKPGAKVTIHYTGWTVDGQVFDSSRKQGRPAEFELGGLIQGWQIGIPGMKPGGVRKLVIPPALGYGEKGSPPDIPPNATLIFEVELIK